MSASDVAVSVVDTATAATAAVQARNAFVLRRQLPFMIFAGSASISREYHCVVSRTVRDEYHATDVRWPRILPSALHIVYKHLRIPRTTRV